MADIDFSKYGGTATAPRASAGGLDFSKYGGVVEGPEERQTIVSEIHGGNEYTGTPHQIEVYHGGGTPEEKELFRKGGFTPEAAGLAIKKRAKGTGEKVAEGALQTAGQVGGAVLGGVGGSALGGAAAESLIHGIDKYTGQDTDETLLDAALRGGKEGLVTGLMGKAGGFLGRVGGKSVGSLAPRLGKVGVLGGELAGETAGMAGVSAAKDIAEGNEPGLHNVEDAALYALAGRGIGAAGKKVAGLRSSTRDMLGRVAEGTVGMEKAPPASLRHKVAAVLKAPLKRIKAKENLSQERVNAMGTSVKKTEADLAVDRLRNDLDEAAGLKEAQAAMGPHTESVRGANAELAGARAEKKAAAMEHQAELQARTAGAPASVEEAIASGKKRVKEVLGENWEATTTRTKGSTETTGTNAGLSIPSEIARPDYGFLAKELEEQPEIAHIMRKHLGEEFLPSKAELQGMDEGMSNVVATKRGSYAMKQREARLNQLIKERGPEWAEQTGKGYAEDLSSFMLGHPEYGQGLTTEELKNLGKAAAGMADRQTIDSVMKTFSKKVSGRSITPRMFAANKAFDEAQLKAWKAQAALRSSPEAARLSRAKQTRLEAESTIANSPEMAAKKEAAFKHKEQLLEGRKAAERFGKLNPKKTPYANFGQQWLGVPGGMHFGGGLLGGGAAYMTHHPVLAAAGVIWAGLHTKAGARLLHGIGDILQKGVPTSVGAYLRPVHEAVKNGDSDLAKTMLIMAADKSEDVKQWLQGQLGIEGK